MDIVTQIKHYHFLSESLSLLCSIIHLTVNIMRKKVPMKKVMSVCVPWHICNSFLTVICSLYFDRQDVTEDDLRLLFSNAGGTVKAFKFFQYVDLTYSNISHMCLLWTGPGNSLLLLPSSHPTCNTLWCWLKFSIYVCVLHKQSKVCFLWYLTTASYFSGIVKWLWSRCQQWKRPSRPWLTFTTTTWEATSTWESPSPSPPFKNLTRKHLTVSGLTVKNIWDCVWTLGGNPHWLNQFCCWAFVDPVIPWERLKPLTCILF